MVNQNRNREVAPDQNLDQNLAQDQGPDLDQNADPSQGVKVGPDLDQTPGRDVEQNQEADHPRTNPGPGHLRRLGVVPGHLQKVLRVFSWGSESINRKTRIIDVVYNAVNNEVCEKRHCCDRRYFIPSII